MQPGYAISCWFIVFENESESENENGNGNEKSLLINEVICRSTKVDVSFFM